MKNPAKDLATFLGGNTVAGVALVAAPGAGANVFVGVMRPVSAVHPARSVWLLNTGGIAPQPSMGKDEDLHQAALQLRIRSNPGEFTPGENLARGCFETLHRAEPIGYAAVLATGEPTYLEQDEQGCHHWALNFEVWWQE